MNKVFRVVGLGVGFAALAFGGYLLMVGGLVLGLAAVGLFVLLIETVFHSVLLNILAGLVAMVVLGKAVGYLYER